MGTELELDALRWVQQGYCLAHDPRTAAPIFIHGALPGERVRVRLVKSTSGHAFAVTLKVLTAAAERQASDCAAFPACGGCSFRHMPYDAELRVKLELLNEMKYLRECRATLRERVHTAAPDGYRLRARLHTSALGPGFYAPHSRQVIPVPPGGCAQLAPELNKILRDTNAGQQDASVVRGELVIPAPGTGRVREEIALARGPLTWEYPDDGFFQANRFLLGAWLDAVRRLFPAGRPDTAELFCGTGLIGGSVRDLLGEYFGYDNGAPVLDAARSNFDRAKLRGRFFRRDLYRAPPELPAQIGAALVNPPRAGLNRPLVEALSSVPVILYSSCNSQTLNRDLGWLLPLGYRVRALEVFDFFPRTPHLELLILLERQA